MPPPPSALQEWYIPAFFGLVAALLFLLIMEYVVWNIAKQVHKVVTVGMASEALCEARVEAAVEAYKRWSRHVLGITSVALREDVYMYLGL